VTSGGDLEKSVGDFQRGQVAAGRKTNDKSGQQRGETAILSQTESGLEKTQRGFEPRKRLLGGNGGNLLVHVSWP
jgi:hypothetical protein